VLGLGVTGAAVVEWATARGITLTVVEDHPAGDDYEARAAAARVQGHHVVAAPGAAELDALVRAADIVIPSPGVPESHPVFATARVTGTAVRSEIELAGAEFARRRVPLVAITGTNGKTTVTTLVTEMLRASGLHAIAAGNIGTPLLAVAVADHAPDVVVAEVSSFQLRFTAEFRPAVAVLLNVAPDHLDWHSAFDEYVAAKAMIIRNQRDDDVFVFNADDPAVAGVATGAPARTTSFTLTASGAGWRVADGALTADDGTAIVAVAELPRRAPSDLANGLAAAAAARAAGAEPAAIANVLRGFAGLPHRVTLVGQSGGVQYFDDSKATNPHATVSALGGFSSVVLIAGGRNKGLDLAALRPAAGPVRAVVAIGDAASEIEVAFAGLRPVTHAASMHDAVQTAARLAEPGDAVLLSPACASFDWYRNYRERGDDFAREVAALLDHPTASGEHRGEHG